MKLPNRIYEFYKTHLHDILLLIVVFLLVFFARNIPYINLLIINLDPFLISIVMLWVIFYFLKTPSPTRVIKAALIIFVLSYFFVLFRRQYVAELFSSLSFVMLFTAAIVDAIKLKKSLKSGL